jgi:hypothetical protein
MLNSFNFLRFKIFTLRNLRSGKDVYLISVLASHFISIGVDAELVQGHVFASERKRLNLSLQLVDLMPLDIGCVSVRSLIVLSVTFSFDIQLSLPVLSIALAERINISRPSTSYFTGHV